MSESSRQAQLRARVVELARAQDPYAHIYAGKEFRRDYVAGRTMVWSELFKDMRDTTIGVLEIGSKEGRSALMPN